MKSPKAAWGEIKRKIVVDAVAEQSDRARNASLSVYGLFMDVIREQKAYREGRLPKKALRSRPRDLISLAKALYHASLADRMGEFAAEVKIQIGDEK